MGGVCSNCSGEAEHELLYEYKETESIRPHN